MRAALLSLVLSGCIALDARPYEEFLRDVSDADTDADSDSDADTDTAPPPFQPTLCSVDGGDPISVFFVNNTAVAANLYWVPSDCTPFDLGLLVPGIPTPFDTSVGHAFWLADSFSGEWLGEVQVQAADTTIDIGGVP